MKKLLFVVVILFLMAVSVNAADLIVYDRVESTGGVTFNEESTGGWDAIELPSTVESVRHVAIQVNDGSGSVSDTTEPFLWSFDSDGAEYFYNDGTGVSLSLGKKASEVIIYIKTAAASQDITITALR